LLPFPGEHANVLGCRAENIVVRKVSCAAQWPFNQCVGMPMPNDTEAMALALIRLLHEASDGEAMQWHMVRQIDGTEGAFVFAFQQGWLLIDGNRAALTDLGYSIAEELGRPLH